MSTSQTSILSKPIPGQQISAEAFAYMRARAKRHAYDLVMSEFKKSGITKAELARRLFGERGADRVSRMLGGPGNWTIKTVSDLLFAISGAEPTYGIAYPLEKARRNFTGYSKYLADQTSSSTIETKILTIDEFTEEETEDVVVESKDVDIQSIADEVLMKPVELVE